MAEARPIVGPDSRLARFADEQRVKGGKVHWRVFLPSKKGQELESSVFDISGLDEEAVWHLADVHVADVKGVPVVGASELTAREATIPPLFVAVAEPPERHMAIRGWTDWDMALAFAKKLGAAASSHLRV